MLEPWVPRDLQIPLTLAKDTGLEHLPGSDKLTGQPRDTQGWSVLAGCGGRAPGAPLSAVGALSARCVRQVGRRIPVGQGQAVRTGQAAWCS